MIVLFPGAPMAIVIMGVAMEAAKLVTVAFLAHQWRLIGRLSRAVLVTLVAGLAAINAAGVYSQLVAAHLGDRMTAQRHECAVSQAAKAMPAFRLLLSDRTRLVRIWRTTSHHQRGSVR